MDINYRKYQKTIENSALSAQRLRYWAVSREDAVQIGWVAFLELCENKTEDPDGNFDAAIALRVRGAVFDEARKTSIKRVMKKGVKKSVPLHFVSFEDLEHEEDSLVCSGTEISEGQQNGFNGLIGLAGSKFASTLLALHFLHEFKMSDIGGMFSLTKSQVCFRINCAKKEILCAIIEQQG